MSESEPERIEHHYTEWRCTNCGYGTPKNTPPCDRCGNMEFEQVEVHESDFDDEIRGASTLELLRENALSVGAGLVILAVFLIFLLANAGVFVVADPLGQGYRFGEVPPATPNDDGTLTAAEFHGQVAADHEDTSLRWNGRQLQLSYTSRATTNDALADELTEIAVEYATYVGDGGDAASLRITADLEGRGRAQVVVDRADAAAFASGDLSEAEYRSRVLDSS